MNRVETDIRAGDKVRVVEFKENSSRKTTIKQGVVISTTTIGAVVMDPKETGEVSNPDFCEWFPFNARTLKIELVEKKKKAA